MSGSTFSHLFRVTNFGEIHDILVRLGSGAPATKEALVLSGSAD
jgi:hypothetical protein